MDSATGRAPPYIRGSKYEGVRHGAGPEGSDSSGVQKGYPGTTRPKGMERAAMSLGSDPGVHLSCWVRSVSSGFRHLQTTRRQNFDATPGMDWAISLKLSIARHVKFDTLPSKF